MKWRWNFHVWILWLSILKIFINEVIEKTKLKKDSKGYPTVTGDLKNNNVSRLYNNDRLFIQ